MTVPGSNDWSFRLSNESLGDHKFSQQYAKFQLHVEEEIQRDEQAARDEQQYAGNLRAMTDVVTNMQYCIEQVCLCDAGLLHDVSNRFASCL